MWRGLADLGVLAINVPAAQGGLGFGPLETLAMMGACGRSLLLEPVLSSAVIATAALRAFADQAPAAELLAAMATGEKIAALAHFERDARFESQWVTTRAQRIGAGYRLDGHKAVVMHAGAADTLLVSARTVGEAGDAARRVLVPGTARDAGSAFDEYPHRRWPARRGCLLAGRRSARRQPTGRGRRGRWRPSRRRSTSVLRRCAPRRSASCRRWWTPPSTTCASRQQFGQPIGRFQALQHRIADMLIHLEQARSMSYLAALRCTGEDVGERRRALSAAKAVVGQACRFVGQQAVQLHGGMGMTDELKVSHWFKRLTAAQLMFGDSDTHLQRYAALTRCMELMAHCKAVVARELGKPPVVEQIDSRGPASWRGHHTTGRVRGVPQRPVGHQRHDCVSPALGART